MFLEKVPMIAILPVVSLCVKCLRITVEPLFRGLPLSRKRRFGWGLLIIYHQTTLLKEPKKASVLRTTVSAAIII